MDKRRWYGVGSGLLIAWILMGCGPSLVAQEKREPERFTVQTYTLQQGEPGGTLEVLRPYLVQSAVGRNPAGGHFLTLTFEPRYRSQIESLLQQMEVPAGRVGVDIYTLVASRRETAGGGGVPGELRPVVEKMKGVIQFQHLTLDGMSQLQVSGRDGKGEVLLGSRFFHTAVGSQLRFEIRDVLASQGKEGCQLTGELRVRRESVLPASGKVTSQTGLLESQLRIPCNGFFVGGVSSLGTSDQALVLIIRARLL